jgi:hypothetical protein
MVSILAGGPALSRVADAESSPACVVEVSLEPERAFVGQQILYRARVLMRDDVESIEWSRPLAFPRIRTEFLPGEPRGGGWSVVASPTGSTTSCGRSSPRLQAPGR